MALSESPSKTHQTRAGDPNLPLRTFSNGCPSVICTNYPSGERGGKRHKMGLGRQSWVAARLRGLPPPNFGLPRVNPNVRGGDHKYGNGSGEIGRASCRERV